MDESKQEFPSNSFHTSIDKAQQTPPPPANKVADGKVKKQSLADKIADAFFYADIKTVMKDVVYKALVPDIKAGVLNALSMAFNQSPYRGVSSITKATVADTSVTISSQPPTTGVVRSPGARRLVKNIVYPTYDDAKAVIDQMRSHLAKYPYVTVARYYTLSSISSEGAFDTYYGWKQGSISNDVEYIVDNNDGTFSLRLPDPVQVRRS